jgi:thiamine kinase-like enzyme
MQYRCFVEYASLSYRGHDIANHFCEWMANYDSSQPHVLLESSFPTHEEQLSFARAYVSEYCDRYQTLPPTGPLSGPSIGTPNIQGGLVTTDARISVSAEKQEHAALAIVREANVCIPVSDLMWGLWGVTREAEMLQHREIVFDYWSYGLARLTRFWQAVEEEFTSPTNSQSK